jgi:hypothetical protein
MPRFYLHVTMQDKRFPDLSGYDFNDLEAAHSHAMLLVNRLMSYCEIERHEPRPDRWIVTIEDETNRAVMSLIIRCNVVRTSTECDRLFAVPDHKRLRSQRL